MVSKINSIVMCAGLAGIFALMAISSLWADEYRIGPEDVLEVSFWQKPEIGSSVRVSLDGTITIDKIGRIEAAGKTTEELQNDIIRQISRLDREISQAVVRVTQFNYHHVFLTGEVETPGKLSFEEIPDLWSLINEAGGVTDIADLTRVTIVRGGEAAGQVEIVNVSDAIARGTIDRLPRIRRLDTIELPRNLMGIQSRELARTEDQKNVIYVVGAVTAPGAIAFEDGIDILEAISMAGGPHENADMEKASLITSDGRFAQTMQIDLKKYALSGKPARYVVRREDVIYLPPRERGFFGSDIGTIVSIMGAITSAVLIYDILRPQDEPQSVPAR